MLRLRSRSHSDNRRQDCIYEVSLMLRNGTGMTLVFMEDILFWRNHHNFGFSDSEPRSLLANVRYVSSIFDYVVNICNWISSDFFLPSFLPSCICARLTLRNLFETLSMHSPCISFLSSHFHYLRSWSPLSYATATWKERYFRYCSYYVCTMFGVVPS
jgi:hypothetical protein